MTYYPLTTPQQNIWKLQKYYESTAIGNITGMLTFDENDSYDMLVLLEQAINYVIKKSDSLRIRLIDDAGTIKQYFSDYVYEQIPVKDYSSYTQEEIMQILQQESETPLPMLCQPLYRFSIIKCKRQYSIFLVVHHLVCDGWSSNMLANQLASYVYHAGKTDGEEVPFFAYTRFIEEEEKYRQSRRFTRDVAYWDTFAQRYFEPSYIKPQMSGSDSVKASRYIYTVSHTETERIYGYCAANEISPDTLYKTAIALYLYNLNHVSSVVIGTPVLNRDGAAAKNTVGMYVSTMPVVLQMDETASIRSHIDQCASNARETFRHCKYAYGDILSRTKHYHSDVVKLFDVMISYENSSITNDTLIATQWLFQGYSENSLTVHIDDRNSDHCLDISYDYQVYLFQTEKEVELLARRIQFIIQQIIDNDEQTVRDIQIIPAEEHYRIINDFNNTAFLQLHDKCMHTSLYELIENQNAGRIIDGNQEYSLAELRQDAEKIDAAVHGEKRIIGVLCERSYAELAAIYGIVRGGNAYLPISPDYPASRIQLLLEQSSCETVLVQHKYRHLVPDALVIENILEKAIPDIVPAISALPDDPLYVIFTSGSTGTPKGAMVSNKSAINRIRWMCDKYFSPETVVMLKTPFTFDVSVWEIFGFALGGFSLYILPPEDHYRQDRVIDHIRRGKVTDLHFVPTVFRYFLDALKKDEESLPSLKSIFLSGESLSAALVNEAPAPIHNLYGPTECAVDVTYYDCSRQESDPVPIGKPIDNCQMYVLDQWLQPLPIGIVGQIFIGGTPVGLGYVNDPVKTKNSFVPDPFSDGQLYRTGDLGYWREDGQLVFVGRSDNQVKIHGQRIELGEIEAVLNTFVPSSVVVFDEGRLIAFYTGEENNRLREQLRHILPHHMIPSCFVCVDAIPLTASGKTDRRALLMVSRQKSSVSAAPATPEEEMLLNAVRDTLQLPAVSITDNFYELGGDSLSSLSVVTLLQDLGYDLSVTDFLKSESLEAAARKMNRFSAVEETFDVGTTLIPPMVKAYQYERPSDPSTFVQSCVIPTNAPEVEVRRALDAVVAHHEMLRAVFTEDGSFSIGTGGYSFRSDPGPLIEEKVSFDLQHGPLVDAVLYPDHLKLTIHHFVVDAVSWAVIVSDFNAALHNESLSAAIASYLEWAMTPHPAESNPWPMDMRPLLQSADPQNPEERYRFSAGAAPNDIVLTALGRAANKFVEGKAGICVETHGRTSSRYGRTVGWFTAVFPIVTENLEETRAALSDVPDFGTGYLPSFGHLPEEASILYNYISLDEDVALGIFPLFPEKISVNCLKQNGELLVEIGVPAGHHPQGITEKLGYAMRRQLEILIADFSEFDNVLQSYSPEDIFDLTPSQLGMYQNWGQYHLRYTIKLGEKPDAQRLEKAVSLLAQRHPILRSKFVQLGDGTVKQFILKDWQLISESDKLFKVNPNGINLIVETHHIILDGWSLSILAKDLVDYYRAPETSVSPTTSFGEYSQWLRTKPTELTYWKALLSGCGVSSDLPHVSNAVGKVHDMLERFISSEGIIPFAKEHRVSINTVLETAFAMLLQRSNPTVLFGKVISGRNAPVFGIDEMVGPFVNTVPVYVKSGGDILSQIHEQSIMTNEFGFTPLVELYAHTDLRRINILFVFENYPAPYAVHLISYKEENEFDLTVSVRETEGGYLLRASYAPEKYERSVIEEMIRNFDASLRHLLSEKDAPDAPQIQSLLNYEPPNSETERTICKMFERVIGIESVGRHDNFYDLGGTSLNMMELLCEAPLDTLSPSEFMQNPTPTGLSQLVMNQSGDSVLVSLYTPEDATAAYVLFPYGGGDAAAYTALVAEFRKRNASVALLFVPWGCNYDLVAEALRSYPLPLCFYSHCAGAVIAMKLLDRVDCVKKYIAGASIPPEDIQNIWPTVPDEMLLSVLYNAGMPTLPQSQEEAMLCQFRENTDEYFCYFSKKNRKVTAGVTLILSQQDIFTRSYSYAAELWNPYIERVDTIHYLDSASHYFQSTKASELAEILLEETSSCCKR